MTIPSFRENFSRSLLCSHFCPTGICVYEPPVRLMKLHVQIVSASQKMLFLLSRGELLIYSFPNGPVLGAEFSKFTHVGLEFSCCIWETGGPHRKRSHAQSPLLIKPSTALEEEEEIPLYIHCSIERN